MTIPKLLAAALAIPVMGFSQIVNVGAIQKIDVPAATPTVAAISPQGDYLLLTSTSNKGLVKYDMSTKQATKLTDAQGAGYEPQVSSDGSVVVYRETSFDKKHLRHVSLNSLNIASGKAKRLVKPTRDLQGYDVSGEVLSTVKSGKLKVKALQKGVKAAERPALSISNGQLMMTSNGETKTFSPNGTDKSYIWPSLSPDGTKVLYYVCSDGAYVCDLDGNNVKPLGIVRAPKWYDNSTVVGMEDQDDGEFIYASSIVAVNLSGERQTLTPDSVVAMYPQTTSDGSCIAFSTPKGETYIININK